MEKIEQGKSVGERKERKERKFNPIYWNESTLQSNVMNYYFLYLSLSPSISRNGNLFLACISLNLIFLFV